MELEDASDSGFDPEIYNELCGENVNEGGKILQQDPNRRKMCRQFNKDLYKQALYIHFSQAVIGEKHHQMSIPTVNASEEERLNAAMSALGMRMSFDVGMGDGEEARHVDKQCQEQNIEATNESGACCLDGVFHEHNSVWEVAQEGLKTICGCADTKTVCEEPNQEIMVQKRSRCSLRSNWYIKKIQKMTMTRNEATDGQVVIRSLVGVDGFKIVANEIFRFVYLDLRK